MVIGCSTDRSSSFMPHVCSRGTGDLPHWFARPAGRTLDLTGRHRPPRKPGSVPAWDDGRGRGRVDGRARVLARCPFENRPNGNARGADRGGGERPAPRPPGVNAPKPETRGRARGQNAEAIHSPRASHDHPAGGNGQQPRPGKLADAGWVHSIEAARPECGTKRRDLLPRCDEQP